MIWTSYEEVMAIGSFRKFKIDFRKFKIQNSKSNRLGGKFPAQHPRSTGESTGQSTPPGPGRLRSRLGCRPGQVGQVLAEPNLELLMCL